MKYTRLSIPVGTPGPAVSKAALDRPGIRCILRLLREKRSFFQVYCDCFVCLLQVNFIYVGLLLNYTIFLHSMFKFFFFALHLGVLFQAGVSRDVPRSSEQGADLVETLMLQPSD
jgi:hypothetical protein